jgi:hypothetical protein
MSNRVVVGFALGVLSGSVVAGVTSSFGVPPAPAVAYAGAALAGVVTSLVAGKPVWKNTASESSIKALAGTFLAMASLYGIRKWFLGVTLDLGSRFGAGALGDVPLGHLPLIAVAIALVFEVDDAFGADPTITSGDDGSLSEGASVANSPPSEAEAPSSAAPGGDG